MVSLDQCRPKPFSLSKGKVALVMIDMQRDFLLEGGYGHLQSGGGPIFQKVSKVIEPCKKVLMAARKLGITVIHTREGHEPDLRDLTSAKKYRQYLASPSNYPYLIGDKGPMGRLLVRGEYGHDLVDQLSPIKGEIIIDKPGKGTFYNTDIHQILVTRGITHLLLCGVTTECCVNTTFREANDHGFECCTFVDCTYGFNEPIVEETLNTFCAYDGLLGYIGNGEELVQLADSLDTGVLGENSPYSKFMSVGFTEQSNLIKSIQSNGGEYLGESSDIDEALETADFVVAVSDSDIKTQFPVLTVSSGMLSLHGTTHTMFGSVSIVAKTIEEARKVFVRERTFDPEDELSRQYSDYPMKPVDSRGIENHFQFAAKQKYDLSGTEVPFEWELLDEVYKYKPLLIEELNLIGKSDDTFTKERLVDLLAKRRQVLNSLQPQSSPDVLICDTSEKTRTITTLLGFPSVQIGGKTIMAEFGLDGALLDVATALNL